MFNMSYYVNQNIFAYQSNTFIDLKNAINTR